MVGRASYPCGALFPAIKNLRSTRRRNRHPSDEETRVRRNKGAFLSYVWRVWWKHHAAWKFELRSTDMPRSTVGLNHKPLIVVPARHKCRVTKEIINNRVQSAVTNTPLTQVWNLRICWCCSGSQIASSALFLPHFFAKKWCFGSMRADWAISDFYELGGPPISPISPITEWDQTRRDEANVHPAKSR